MVTKMQYHVTGHPGLPGLSTLHFIGDADAAGSEVISGRLESFWTAVASSIKAGVMIQTSGVATVIDDATGNVTAQWPVEDWVVSGTNNGDQLPVGTQGLLLLRTGVYTGGREVRGRMFIPAPTESASGDAGEPLPLSISNWVTAASTHLWEHPDFPLGVYSPTYNEIRPLSSIQGSNYFARLSSRQR